MTEKETPPNKAADMRKQAEKIAGETAAQSENLKAMSPEAIRQTLHELRVHQIELEMQNDDLRRMQAELEASRTRYFDLYDLAPVGYVTVSKQGLIIETNLTAATLLGKARSKLVTQLFFRFILKEDRNLYHLIQKQILETGEPQVCELRMLKKDGELFWVHLEAIARQGTDGTLVCYVVLIDITERKRVEEALVKRTHELATESLRLQTLLETASDAIHILDEDGNVVLFSESFLHLLGYDKEEAIALNVEDWDQNMSKEKLVDTIRTLIKHPATFETKHRRRDGTVIDVEINAKGVELDNRSYLYASARDTTQRKLIEKALEEERLRLQQALVEIEILRGIVPICSYCKKIRNDDGYWDQVEKYISKHTGARFSHGICPTCFEREMKEIKTSD